jgi:hypothetical protein
MIDDECGAVGGEPEHSEKICPSATLSTTNPTSPDLGSNPGRRDGKRAINRQSYERDSIIELSHKGSVSVNTELPRTIHGRKAWKTFFFQLGFYAIWFFWNRKLHREIRIETFFSNHNTIYIVAFKPVAREWPRNKQLDNGRY